MFDGLIDEIVNLFYSFLYSIFSCICWLVDFIKDIFYKLCGIDTVEINGEQGDLLTNLITSDIIKKVFLTITIIGVILLVIFTIIAIIKSNYQKDMSLSKVLSKSAQSVIVAICIPLTVLAGIILANTVMSSINTAMNAYESTAHSSIGGQFLVTIGNGSYIGISDRSQVEAMFVNGTLDYTNLNVVKAYYNINSMNYFIGLLGGLVILIMFVLSSLTFVQRIFDVILLYILSPISISTIPLDDGNRFKNWKDMMISKILSAYGIILVMNLFFLIIPQVYQINFFNNDFQNGVVYILFLIGGSFAVTKASRVITSLCGGQQTGGELASMFYNIRSGIAFTRATSALLGGAVGGLIGGADYKKSRKKNGRVESMKKSFQSTRNQKPIKEGQKKSKAKQILGAPTRLASMPLGVLHDLAGGGLIQVGKNFGPRLRNAFTGSTIFNRAEVKTRKPKVRDEKEKPLTEKSEKEQTDLKDTKDMKEEKGLDPNSSEMKQEDREHPSTEREVTNTNVEPVDPSTNKGPEVKPKGGSDENNT